MRTGFTYKGVHTSAIGVTLRTKSRPILPEVRQSLLTLPSYDGTFDYSAANEYGRSMYEDRIFTVVMHMAATDIYELQRKVSRVASWLMGSGELIFDDMPETVWDASVLSEIDFAPELSGRKALLTVNFRVKPFSRSAFDLSQEITLDGNILLNSNIPLEAAATLQFTIKDGTGSFNAFNYGSAPVRAKFILTPSGTADYTGNLSLSCRDRGVVVNYPYLASSGEIIIDTEAGTVICGSRNLSGFVTGRSFELQPGDNTVHLATDNAQDYTVTVSYYARFIYTADWSVADA